MKTLKKLLFPVLTVLFFASCEQLEEQKPIYEGAPQIEIDAAVLNPLSTGRTYPILTRLPGYGRPVLSAAVTLTDVTPNVVVPADPLITRSSASIKLRVNLVTAQQATDQVIQYKVVDTESLSGTTTTVTTAQTGVHFTTSGQFIIPANSSFGEITIQVLNPGATSGTRDLVLELVGNDLVKPSPNYRKIGVRIAQN